MAIATETGSDGSITRLVLFKDGVRVDFQISDQQTIAPDGYDDGYRVLIDKDGLTTGLNPPTFSEYWVKKPSNEEFDTLYAVGHNKVAVMEFKAEQPKPKPAETAAAEKKAAG